MTQETSNQPGPGTDAPAAAPQGPGDSEGTDNPFLKTPGKKTPFLWAGAGLAAGLILGIGIAQIDLGTQSQALSQAVAECAVEDEIWIELGDEGQSLSMDTEGEESSGASYSDVVCVLDELGMPDSVSSRMSNTRALDGRQEAQWGEFSATWGYHPDSGMNVVIEVVEAQ
ncbi:hypothetical protein FYJ28_10615 [Arthrobacter sp. BL-252-APC-1A]|uniref:hypothetical protein n=1 Tax=Arthrobacter sp. BL-252-APC-1A TaxID=2606622 RepID=UPI0012B2B34B|nr:hypothetical protein [Arthrobacter sp. BL-252-APC-1A]MSR99272.1 hypothetical protein [Arthrobacter sp. BL-252-APC-1A]